jgi:hypothetical protein
MQTALYSSLLHASTTCYNHLTFNWSHVFRASPFPGLRQDHTPYTSSLLKCHSKTFITRLRLIYTHHAVPLPCHTAKGLDCVFPIWFTQCGRVWFTDIMPRPCHATTMPFWKRLLTATEQCGMGGAWHVWISIGRPETACGRPARVRLLPATTRSSTKVVVRSITIC